MSGNEPSILNLFGQMQEAQRIKLSESGRQIVMISTALSGSTWAMISVAGCLRRQGSISENDSHPVEPVLCSFPGSPLCPLIVLLFCTFLSHTMPYIPVSLGLTTSDSTRRRIYLAI